MDFEGFKMSDYHLNNDKTMVLGKMRDKTNKAFGSTYVFDTNEVWISTDLSGPLKPTWDFIVCPTKSVESYKLKLCSYK